MSEMEALFGGSLFGGGEAGGFTPDPRFAFAHPDAPPHGQPRGQAHTPPADPLAFARAEGFAEGHAAAHAEGQAQAAIARDAGNRLSLAFARLDADLAEQLRQRLIETVAALCEATLAPLALDRDLLAERVKRAATLFSRADDERVIRLNPDDLEAVRALLPTEWSFLPDPALSPGALRVETASGGAEDGPVHWRRAIAEAIDPAVGK